jgi:hypothetical protein
MIVITRNGKTTVLTGWRAWLAGGVLAVVISLLLSVLFFLMVGFAVTLTAVLLIVVPVVAGVALLASLVRRA